MRFVFHAITVIFIGIALFKAAPCLGENTSTKRSRADKIVVFGNHLFYCRRIPSKAVVFEIHSLRNSQGYAHSSVRVSRLIYPVLEPFWATPSSPPMQYQAQRDELNLFPLSWGIVERQIYIFTPNLMIDSIGRIHIDLLDAENILPILSPCIHETVCEKTHSQTNGLAKYKAAVSKRIKHEYGDIKDKYPYPVLICPINGPLNELASEGTHRMYYAVVRHNDDVLWYAADGNLFIVRYPMSSPNSAAWTPCEKPDHYQWAEYKMPSSGRLHQGVKTLHSNKVDAVGNFNPVGAARVAGKQVLSDSAEAKFPKDADWLIWEKSPDASRLCKMEKGKWATCPDMPVQKPPQLIVTDDDNGIVLLLYSFGIDQSDVEGSLRKVAKMLEDRGFPLKPPQAKPAPEAKGNDVAHSSTNMPPPVAAAPQPIFVTHRPNTNRVNGVQNHAPAPVAKVKDISTNSVVRITAAENAAAEKEFARLGLKPEEKAKRGAILYEKPESRAEGLRLLKESAREGSAFAIARLSALYYLGEGGVKRDYAKAVKLMEAAAAKGFPRSLLPLEEAKKAMARETEMNKKGKPGLWPGMGYHGVLLPYRTSRALQKMLDKYSLSAGVFRRDPLSDVMISEEHRENYLLTEEVPYLLFTPKTSYSSVPLVMYFGGTGEQGSDLTRHFRQRTIFEMVCSPEFQKRRPCYLFAPMVPKGSEMCGARGYSPPMADLVCDAMYAVIRSVKSPSVDTNRLYLTGLSWGGEAAYTFPFGYPGRFAASVPVAGFATAYCVPESKPGNFWLLFNEHEYVGATSRAALDEMIRTVTSRGGEFRTSSFPDKGHNSWDKAWREEKVWDWMFSKTADGRAGQKISRKTVDIPVYMRGVRCAASKPGRDAKTGPERAADGLDATCYVSKTPFKSGDWWQIDFAEPVSGRVIVKSGYVNGRGRVKSAHVETSTNGKSWTRRGGFSKASGECRFPLNSSVRHLRVVSRSSSGETMVIREVEVVK